MELTNTHESWDWEEAGLDQAAAPVATCQVQDWRAAHARQPLHPLACVRTGSESGSGKELGELLD